MVNASLQQLLACLSDGQVHSGEALGARLGVSRAAVWKQIKAARQAGLPLRASRGGGYQLEAGFEMLSAASIMERCSPLARSVLPEIQVLMSVDSTNDEVMRILQAGHAHPVAVLAEKQTAGRGRRGRVWHSPFASNIYLTIGWIFTEGFAAIEGLSLIVGLKAVEALQVLGASELQLKWPNDVYWQQRKLAGILVDVQGDPSGVCQVAIGIGINVNMHGTQDTLIDQPWVDLRSIPGVGAVSRNMLVAELLNSLVPTLLTLPEKTFAAYREEWQRYDVCYGQSVSVQSGSSVIVGRACGVNVHGAYGIDVAIPDGVGMHQPTMYYASGGELSLRFNSPAGKSLHDSRN